MLWMRDQKPRILFSMLDRLGRNSSVRAFRGVPRRKVKLRPNHVANDRIDIVVLRAKSHISALKTSDIPISSALWRQIRG